MGRERRAREELAVEVPSFFRCPISLDLMKSPVSLCTGVTYDRSSIATWLDSGRRTCPATMQILSSTDLTPNHNLRRLIELWSSSSESSSSAAVLRRQDLPLEAMETATLSFHPILHKENVDAQILSSVQKVLKQGNLDSRIAAARIIAGAVESAGIFSSGDSILPELLILVEDEKEEEAHVAGISCLAALSSIKEIRREIFGGGGGAAVIAAASKLLDRPRTAEKAMKVMAMAACSREGRALLMEDKEVIVRAVAERMMKLPLEGKEDAVMVLWVVCCVYGDERGKEEIRTRDGETKMLLTMQSGCSPVVKKMAGDLIKAVRMREKGFFRRYDSANTHVSPF